MLKLLRRLLEAAGDPDKEFLQEAEVRYPATLQQRL